MSVLEAIILGFLQGATEFLPISSTAHLLYVPELAGWDDPGAAFTAVTQLGTLAAVVVYFRVELVRIAASWARSLPGRPLPPTHSSELDPDARLGWFIIIGSIPIVIFGAIFVDDVETAARSLSFVSWAMIGLALLLLLSEIVASHRRPLESLGWFDAISIGLAQAGALVPGVSRSGATLTAGLFVGLRREAAARYSFLLSIPSVFAAGLFELWRLIDGTTALDAPLGQTLLATAVAFVAGYLTIGALLAWLRRHTTLPFVVYRVVVGTTILILLGAGAIG